MGFAQLVVPKSESKNFHSALVNIYSNKVSIHTSNKRHFSTSLVNLVIGGNGGNSSSDDPSSFEYNEELHSNPVGLSNAELEDKFRNDPKGLDEYMEDRLTTLLANTQMEARLNARNLDNNVVEQEEFELVADHIYSEYDRMVNEVARTNNEVRESIELSSDYDNSSKATTNEADTSVSTNNQQSAVDFVIDKQAEEFPGYG